MTLNDLYNYLQDSVYDFCFRFSPKEILEKEKRDTDIFLEDNLENADKDYLKILDKYKDLVDKYDIQKVEDKKRK